MTLCWRRLGRADARAAAALLVDAHGRNRDLGVAFPAARAGPADVEAALAAGAALLAATGPAGAPLAMGAVWPDGEIGWLAVAGAAAGRGLGDRTLAAVEGLALALGHDRVHLRTASAHPWLGDWYRRRGYADGEGAGGGCDLRLARDLADSWRPVARRRCEWAEREPRMAAYHDFEWGLWLDGDRDLFERLILELFQAGLSWRTVLVKRAALRAGLLGLEPTRLARADAADEARFLATAGVIRSPRKFRATVHNARVLGELTAEHGSLAGYLRGRPPDEVYAELRPRLRHVGPSVMRSFFESVGLVAAPHAEACGDAAGPCAGLGPVA